MGMAGCDRRQDDSMTPPLKSIRCSEKRWLYADFVKEVNYRAAGLDADSSQIFRYGHQRQGPQTIPIRRAGGRPAGTIFWLSRLT